MTRHAVEATAEFERVRDLPRRTWSEEDATELARMLTAELKTRFGTMSLRPIQGLMMAEGYDANGLFAACGVGSGKTIPSFCLPTLMKAERPLLLVKANLLEKTKRAYAAMAYHWHVHPRLRFETYERLSVARADGLSILDEINPDLVLADEGQSLKNRQSARGRKFLRYFERNRGTRFAYFSGGIQRKSLTEFWHLMCLALPDGAPIPYIFHQLETWADAVAPRTDAEAESGDLCRPEPGCLVQFVADEDAANDDEETDGGELDPLVPVWRGLRRRFVQTRGVVATSEAACDADIILNDRPVSVTPTVEAALRQLRTTWTTPNGDELTEAVRVWSHARELACGFYYRWTPPPPEEWMNARREWNRYVRMVLSHHRDGLDSPKQVALRYPDDPRLVAWRKVRDLYDPTKNQRAEWIDDFLLRDAAAWMAAGPGIVWVEHNAFGRALAKLTGHRYFGGGPEASAEIIDVGVAGRVPIIASISAHGTGKDLYGYSRQLIVSCPPSSDVLEQLFGRTHREGQRADEIITDMYRHCEEVRAGFDQLLRDARYTYETTGMPQRVLQATRTFDASSVGDGVVARVSFR